MKIAASQMDGERGVATSTVLAPLMSASSSMQYSPVLILRTLVTPVERTTVPSALTMAAARAPGVCAPPMAAKAGMAAASPPDTESFALTAPSNSASQGNLGPRA